MKFQFKSQKFQADAARAVVDVFAGQPYSTPTYMIDRGNKSNIELLDDFDYVGWNNEPLIPELTDEIILKNLQNIQKSNGLKPSEKLEGKFNLTVEMETGVGKTYTYIKTIYELNKAYGWTKFIVVVPSIAIREGVYKTFSVTREHFVAEYNKTIRYFIYNSSRLSEIQGFASDNNINVMIINSQAFNSTGKDARRIGMELDEFRSRKPIEVIAKTNPVVIIDEPQSVEGEKTKENLKKFEPLLTLRYSATHKSGSIYNMVYRLDAMEAYNKHLVKKIVVKGISQKESAADESFLFLEDVNVSEKAPTANLRFEIRGKNGVKTVTRKVSEGDNIYDLSGKLEEYRDRYVVSKINGYDNSAEFINGVKLTAGDFIGKVSDEQKRRIQIRETILSHIERERELFYKGIKVLSLFFIDHVENYRKYDESGDAINGIYADMFEEEYQDIINHLQLRIGGEKDYLEYLHSIDVNKTHAGYFSIDSKTKHLTDPKLGKGRKKENISDDPSSYDLIMKDKELLLDRNPERSPVRFIFSHSALREGWDNPNVFQICTLKESSSEIRKRQEVGRGLRLCVDEHGERMDYERLQKDVDNVNVLTVVASESYEKFAAGLQTEWSEAVADRPRKVTSGLFVGKSFKNANGEIKEIDQEKADEIIEDLIHANYISRGMITDKFYEDKENNAIKLSESNSEYISPVIEILDTVYNSKAMSIEDARKKNVELKVDEKKLASREFKELWKRINAKSVYAVDFDTDELIHNSILALNDKLHVTGVYYRVETGVMQKIASKDILLKGEAFERTEAKDYDYNVGENSSIKYDLVGKLVDATGLTRKAICKILQGIGLRTFNQFSNNPEDFIIKAADIINQEKAGTIIEHITYNVLDDKYDSDIFTKATLRGQIGVDVFNTKKHLYDHLLVDSAIERKFAEELDVNKDVAVYVKLPNGFYISTPVGNYNPDWAIAFYEGTVKHIYFVAETKGSTDSLELRKIESAKIQCAKKHFKAISRGDVIYDVIDNYQTLLSLVKN